MIFDPKKHHRRSVRLKGYDYAQLGGYFVTIVSYQRECLFGEIVNGEMCLNDLGKVVKLQWEKLVARFSMIELGTFVVMPNHIHAVIVIRNGRGTAENTHNKNFESLRRAPTTERFGKPVIASIPTVIRSFKAAATLRINLLREADALPVWQSNYYEHVIRNQADWERIDAYIQANPAMWADDDENPQS
jgi:REP element-mobilizing transposase RayT